MGYGNATYDDEYAFDNRAGFGGGAFTHLQRYQAAVARGDAATAQALEAQAQFHTTQNIKDRSQWQGIYNQIEKTKAGAQRATAPAAPTPTAPARPPSGAVPVPLPPPILVTDVVPVPNTQTTVGPPVSTAVGGPSSPPSGGGGGDGGFLASLFPTGGGDGGAAGAVGFLTSPAGLIAVALIGFWALRKSGGSRRL